MFTCQLTFDPLDQLYIMQQIAKFKIIQKNAQFQRN